MELNYTQELETDIMANIADYYQLGETVCGAADPAVVELANSFKRVHPELAHFTAVRIVDRYVSPWSSATVFVFSNQDITPEEYAQYETYVDSLD